MTEVNINTNVNKNLFTTANICTWYIIIRGHNNPTNGQLQVYVYTAGCKVTFPFRRVEHRQ